MEMRLELIACKFSSPIALKGFDFAGELNLNKSLKLLKNNKSLRF
jgi:hypothetical protein